MSEARTNLWPAAVAVGAALAVNGLLAAAGIEGDVATDPDPPGWVVGGVWTAIFACFGMAYAALPRGTPRAAVVGLGLLCLAYPLYTAGFALRAVALGGTLLTAAVALGLVAWFWRVSRPAALWVAPVLPWLVFAAVMLV